MLATKDFVLLNMPKTGSSFARSIIKKTYRARATRSPLSRIAKLWGVSQLSDPLEEILVAPLDAGYRSGLSQHGTIEQIPYRHRAKPIISVTRHPLARLVSAYRFKDWARFPPAQVTQLEAEFPSWPNLSVEEWYDMVHRFTLKNRLRGHKIKADMGIFQVQFIQMYYRTPMQVLVNTTEEDIDSGLLASLIPRMQFLRQENLRNDLRTLLLSYGFMDDELSIIDQHPDLNLTGKSVHSSRKSWSSLLPQTIRSDFVHRNRLLFQIFPEYAND